LTGERLPAAELPLVSIGLPVHNAERYLRNALDSLLGQDYSNLEVIISDNASDDATGQICTEYARRDGRLLYHRVERNLGAIWNFNRVFELAHGEYFMWAAFDDLRDPRYVSACVSALELRQDAVLCATDTVLIDENGQEVDAPLSAYGHHPTGRTARERLRRVARSSINLDFYGLVRRSVLARVRPLISSWGCDVVFVLELCLRGPVLLVPEPLFSYRLFQGKTQQDLAVGLSGSATNERVPVCWSCLTVELLRSIWLAPAGWVERLLLSAEFMLHFCLLNVPLAAGIRRDLTSSIRQAWSLRAWGRLVVLVSVGLLVYPVHNQLARSVYRGTRALVRVFRRTRLSAPSAGTRL
jgi:Glycosyl transferase family 2